MPKFRPDLDTTRFEESLLEQEFNFGPVRRLGWQDPSDDWIWVALHGGFFVTISTALLAIGPRYLPSAEVALLILVESVLAPILAWVVVGEDPGKWALIGGAVVVGALAVSNMIALMRGRRVAVKPGPPRT